MVGVKGAYYNEFDPNAAAWLRELIKRGLIAPGEVDERSISDVTPDDLIGFTQHHWFAGIAGWSLALRLAGWPDDRPVWTGSCPCQPFSSAGKGAGFADERHLWPHWNWLIEKCRPATVFGEQVASKDGLGWFDLVSADLEGQGYAVGASDMCAAGFGAPHIRQRLWWVGLADSDDTGSQGRIGMPQCTVERTVGSRDLAGGLGDSECSVSGWRSTETSGSENQSGCVKKSGDHRPVNAGTGVIRLADSGDDRRDQGRERIASIGGDGSVRDGAAIRLADTQRIGRTNAPDSQWRDADWLYCRDGKWRPVESGTFPLDHGIPARVGRLRGYGNAIVPQIAAEWIKAVMEC